VGKLMCLVVTSELFNGDDSKVKSASLLRHHFAYSIWAQDSYAQETFSFDPCIGSLITTFAKA